MIFKILIVLWLGVGVSTSLRLGHKQMSHDLYKDNLSAQNWYYGSISALDYRVRIFKAATTQTLSACPLATPYMSADMSTCESCPPDRPLRNLGSYSCQACPAGQNYNSNVGNCSAISSSGGSVSGITSGGSVAPTVTTTTTEGTGQAGIQSNYSADPTVVRPVAPSSTPTATNVINITTTTTTTTTPSTTPATSTTATTPVNSATTNVVPVVYNNTQTPATTITTTTNTSGTDYNYAPVIEPVPTPAPAPTPIPAPTTIVTNTSTVTPTTTTPTTTSNTTTVQPMPTPAPVTPSDFQGNLTHNCTKSAPFYNATSKKCQACRTGTQYINTTMLCLPIIYVANIDKSTNLIQPYLNYTLQQTQAIKAEHPTRTVQQCPISTPYLSVMNQTTGRVCVGCDSKLYYAVATQKCISGCPPGTLYNSTLKLCLVGSYVTDPTAQNLISPTMKYQSWKQSILTQKATGVNVQYCPSATPYQMNNTCGSCTGGTPYFDVENKVCISCGTGRYYSGDDKRCLSSWSGSMSLERMVANIL